MKSLLVRRRNKDAVQPHVVRQLTVVMPHVHRVTQHVVVRQMCGEVPDGQLCRCGRITPRSELLIDGRVAR
jgi:hypothetical protein